MPNPFLSPEVFNPTLAAKVAAAYECNVERGLVPGATLAARVGARGLGGQIKSATLEAVHNHTVGFDGFNQVDDLEVKLAFEVSFAEAKQLYDRINLVIPTVEQFVDGGVDLVELADNYARMEAEGLEPALVLAPELHFTRWSQLYEHLAIDLPSNVDGNQLSRGGIDVGPATMRYKDELERLPGSVPRIVLSGAGPAWHLRLASANLQALIIGDQDQYYQPTVDEYLSLQAARLQAGLLPLDDERCVWLSGTFTFPGDNILRAPIAYWSSTYKHVRISYCSQQSPTVGNRRVYTPIAK